jgi:hypothetical protein
MTNRQACGIKPQGSQMTGANAAIPNFGKSIWATAASSFPAFTEFDKEYQRNFRSRADFPWR